MPLPGPTLLCRWDPQYAGYLVIGYANVLAGNLVLSDHTFIPAMRAVDV